MSFRLPVEAQVGDALRALVEWFGMPPTNVETGRIRAVLGVASTTPPQIGIMQRMLIRNSPRNPHRAFSMSKAACPDATNAAPFVP